MSCSGGLQDKRGKKYRSTWFLLVDFGSAQTSPVAGHRPGPLLSPSACDAPSLLWCSQHSGGLISHPTFSSRSGSLKAGLTPVSNIILLPVLAYDCHSEHEYGNGWESEGMNEPICPSINKGRWTEDDNSELPARDPLGGSRTGLGNFLEQYYLNGRKTSAEKQLSKHIISLCSSWRYVSVLRSEAPRGEIALFLPEIHGARGQLVPCQSDKNIDVVT